MTLDAADEALRGLLTRRIAELGHAPTNQTLADEANLPLPEIEASLHRLADAHALLLHPHRPEPWVVHPFALAPGSCWVDTDAHGYWANCLYCGLGIAAALGRDATITTRFGGEADTAIFRVRDGELLDRDGVFHLSTPVHAWWDNVVFACATFQPFRDEPEVDRWCERHTLPKGAVMTLPALWAFAGDWYGGYLDAPWRKRTVDETRALFARHGLTGDFWSVD